MELSGTWILIDFDKSKLELDHNLVSLLECIFISSFAIHNHIRSVVSCLLCGTTATLNPDTVTNIDIKVT